MLDVLDAMHAMHGNIDARGTIPYRRTRFSIDVMNAKLLLKTVFLILVLLLLVLMGMSNRKEVSFSLPPLITRSVNQPAAIMYFAFFAIGVITGTVLNAGGKKSGSSGGSKASKN